MKLALLTITERALYSVLFVLFGAIVGSIATIEFANSPRLVGYACEVEPGEFVTLFARAESDFPPCATIERNFWAK